MINRLYYIWTSGHLGATGEAPSGPIRMRLPILASSEEEAREKAQKNLTSWDGVIKKVTTDETYSPKGEYVW